MKKLIMISLFLTATAALSLAQEDTAPQSIPLIGSVAPSFTAQSTQGTITFPEDYGRKWKILFSHPADYTPVCSSEILAMATMQQEFDKLGVKLAVVSTDALDKHYSWKKSLESIRYNGKEPVKINFPLIDDQNKSIARLYGMLHPESPSSRDVRGVFIIDPADKVEAVFFYPNNVGRNMDEIKRTVIALQTASDYSVLTPANWKPGDDVLLPYLKSVDEALVQSGKEDPEFYSLTWYMWFKKHDVK